MYQQPAVFRRILKRLGPKAALQMIFDKEAGMTKMAIALKYHLSPSYMTDFFQHLNGFTTYAIPQDFLLSDMGAENISVLNGSRERAAYLRANGHEPVAPKDAAEYLVDKPDELQFPFILNPTLRAAAYWAKQDLKGY